MPKERCILLVEDNPDEAELALHAFRASGVRGRVVVASDGAEALDYLFDEGKPAPLLILLDLNLPKISGIDVLRKLRAHPRTSMIPVVVLSTSSERQDVSNSYQAGANSYIVKSIDFGRFSEAIRQIAQYWLDLDHGLPPR